MRDNGEAIDIAITGAPQSPGRILLAVRPERVSLGLAPPPSGNAALKGIVRGHVFGPGGDPTGDGAIEGRAGDDYTPIGRIEPDGTYRFTTVTELDIELRAWPWKSPPSNSMKFACKEGVRYANVTLQVQARSDGWGEIIAGPRFRRDGARPRDVP